MGDQRDVSQDGSQDGTAGEEGWRDDAAPTSPSDLDIEVELEEDELEGDDGAEDTESGAGYGNNAEVPPNPD